MLSGTHSRPPFLFALFYMTWLLCLPTARGQTGVGTLDTSYNTGAILNGATAGAVRTQAVSGTQTIIAGDFTSVGGVARGRIARLNTDGSLDATFASGAGADGPIHALVVQADGNIIIGGEFTTFDGVSRNRIARLTSDGALDTTFNPGTGCNGPVYAIAYFQTLSSIYIGGDFTTCNASSRNRLALLTSTGGLSSSTFGGGANAAVRVLRVDSSSLYVGGDFTTAGGQARAYLARYSLSSLTLDGFAIAFNGPVLAIEFSDSSTMLVGGEFTSVASTPRGRLAAFTSGSLSSSFNFWLDAPCRQIFPATSSIYIAGDFTTLNGQSRARFARLNMTTTGQVPNTVTSWGMDVNYGQTGPDGPVYALRRASEGRLFLGGAFSSVNGSSTSSDVRFYGDAGSQPPAAPSTPTIEVLSDTQLYVSWFVSANSTAYSLERSTDGLSGWSQIYSGVSTALTESSLSASSTWYYRVRASNTNGNSPYSSIASATTLAAAWTGSGSVLDGLSATFTNGAVSAIVRQPDGKILIAGSFTEVLGTSRKYIARLLPNLTLDSSFDPGTGANSSIEQIELMQDGRIYIYGSLFTTVSGVSRNSIARLNPNGTLDTSFDTQTVWTFAIGIKVQDDGKLIVYGNFQIFFGSPTDRLIRLKLDGSKDTTFNSIPSSTVNAVALLTDGKILLGGSFSKINSTTKNSFARVYSDGTLDLTYPGNNTSTSVSYIKTLPGGKALSSGSFTTINSIARKYLVLFNSDGSVDASFDPGPSSNFGAPLIFPQPDGKIILAGSFTSYTGTTRWKIARINSNGTLDATFNAEAGPGSGSINSILTLPDNSLLVGGSFSSFGKTACANLVRLKSEALSAVPSIPGNFAGVGASDSSIHLTWDAVPETYSWKIERSPAGANQWQQITELSWDKLTFDDTGLVVGSSYDYRIRGSNGIGDSAYSTTVTTRTLKSYEQWKLDQGFTLAESDTSDSDGDGISLLMEYSFELDPHTNQLSSSLPVTQIIGDLFAMSYVRFRSDINYSVEVSTDLQNWSTGGVNQGSGIFPIAWITMGGAPQKFLRVRVSVP